MTDSSSPAPLTDPVIPTATPSLDASGMEKTPVNTSLHQTLRNTTMGVYAGFGAMTAATWLVELGSAGPLHFNLGPLFLIPPIAHFFSTSLVNVEANELGAEYWYGECIRTLKPGLHFVPARPWTNVVKFVHDTQPIVEPGPRDKIFWGEEDKDLPEGMVRPIYMQTRAPKPDEKGPLDAQVQVGLGYEVIWVVEDVPTFLTNMHTIDEARGQLRSVSTSALSEVLVTGTADDAISNQAEVNRKFYRRLIEMTQNWGVGIRRATITDINLSHPLASAMRDRAKAEFVRETTRIEATGKAEAIKLIGQAEGEALRDKTEGPLLGRARGFGHMTMVMAAGGDAAKAVLAAETARETIPGANATILGPDGLAQAASIGQLFGVGLNNSKPKKEKSGDADTKQD